MKYSFKETSFRPVILELTLESQAEVDAAFDMCNRNATVAKACARNADIERVLTDMLLKLYTGIRMYVK